MLPRPTVFSRPGSPQRPNEDRAKARGRVAVVVDGAGMPTELRGGCRHDVAWYADTLADALLERLEDETASMQGALQAALGDTLDSHGSGCHPSAGSPSATVAAWRLRPDWVEYLVLGDASVCFRTHDARAEQVTDHRLDEAIRPLVQRAVQEGRSGAALREARLDAVERTRNTPGGFWCCHHQPEAALQAIVGRRDLATVQGVVLASDGATRGFETLGCHSLDAFVRTALEGHHDRLLETVRAAELAQSASLQSRGEKVHDDLSVVSLTVRSSG